MGLGMAKLRVGIVFGGKSAELRRWAGDLGYLFLDCRVYYSPSPGTRRSGDSERVALSQ